MRMLRYEVPVDDQWHEVEIIGDPLHLECRSPLSGFVEFWALAETGHKPAARSFRVFGTGQTLESDSWPLIYRGTTLAGPAGSIVWHLFEAPGVRS